MTKTLLLNAVTLITTFTRLHLSWPHLGAQRCSDDDAICRDSQGPTQQHQLRQLDPYHHDIPRSRTKQSTKQGHCSSVSGCFNNFRNLHALFKNLKKKSFVYNIICSALCDDERTHWAKGRGGHEDSNAAQRCHLCIQRRQSSWVSNETLQAMSLFDTKNISSQDPPALPSKHLQSEEDLIITRSEQTIPNWYEVKSSNIRNITSSRDAYNPAQPRQF